MKPQLPIDILEEIFENLESLISTLHSCLLLSRECCKTIIPILYRQPFQYTRKNPSPKLIDTYLSNLTSDDLSYVIKVDIDLLEKFNIKLPINDNNSNNNNSSNSNNNNNNNEYFPIFNYHSHLRRLNYRDLYDFSIIWYRSKQKVNDLRIINNNERYKFTNPTEDEPYSQEPMKTLSRILLNLFMSKGAKLNYLFMDSGKELINQELNLNADDDENNDDFENFIDEEDKYLQTPTISFPVLDVLQNYFISNFGLIENFGKNHDLIKDDDDDNNDDNDNDDDDNNNNNNFNDISVNNNTSSFNQPNPILKNFLENLQIFGFYGRGKCQEKSFDNISSICDDIKTLIINLTVNDEWNTERAKKELKSLNNLINNQKNLKEFIFVEYQGKFWWSPSSRLRDMEIDFSHHINNLLVVEFYDVDFQSWKPLHVFASLTNLEELTFISCRHQENVMSPLKYSSYKKLKKLSIIGWNGITSIDPKVVEILIENSIDSLKSLSIILTHDVSTIVLSTISKFQPNLIELSLKFDQTHYITLQSLPFYGLENLEKLTLSNWGYVPIDVELILPLLGKSLPPNLKKLQILARWTFSINALREFLNNCEAKLKFIDIRHCSGITEEHVDLIWTRLSDSLERLIIRDTENRRLNDEVPYGQAIEAKSENFLDMSSANFNDASSSCNVSSSSDARITDEKSKEKKPTYTRRAEVEPSEDEVYSYIRIDQLRYRWE
ncbi:hypothetical protein RclHR1_03500013 [Rhizophagus clarus]|uniref:F-box domain-containing protein n=1 Tax=Rhizophagus clarus TaxID=94130 RepID=A0A2Z6S5L6_9GLOM|nr:hypothetical protein RclHR1_03500013 [Rhizophagus clarus]GES94867.1 hypothetical protein GLOIN_2v1518949 [Rhizophagus clarus]